MVFMTKRRVLLMYITEVSGHHRATLAIENSLRALIPDVELKRVNGFSYVYPRMEKIVNKAYMGVIKRTPQVWDFLYDNPKIFRRTRRIKEFLQRSSHKKLAALLNEFQPDTVVCTQAFPCGLIADYKRTYHANFTLMGVLTDYAPHAYWINDGVDFYIVPYEESKERFLKHGVPEDKIKIFGIPVDPKFAKSHNKEDVARKLGLSTVTPTVLIMGGGQGLGPIKKIVAMLVRLKKDLQLIVLAGTNKKLIRFLRKVQKRNLKKLIYYEYAENVDELMDLATLIITKPGGMTISESLSKGLPM